MYDIHVIRFHFGGYVAAENDKSPQTFCAFGKFVDMPQAPRASISLIYSPAEALQDLAPRDAMDARRQIAVDVEVRQRHMILRSKTVFATGYFEMKASADFKQAGYSAP
jgi:hypothetical protein